MSDGNVSPDRAAEILVHDSEVTELCAWHREQERNRIRDAVQAQFAFTVLTHEIEPHRCVKHGYDSALRDVLGLIDHG